MWTLEATGVSTFQVGWLRSIVDGSVRLNEPSELSQVGNIAMTTPYKH